jgi:glycosyltransferase involved in cell wall biosynthesis
VPARVRHPEKLGDRLGEPDTCDASFVALFDGWDADLLRLHSSLSAHCSGWELVVVDNPVDEEASERIASLDRVVHVPLAQAMGYGGARNLGLRLALGRIAVVVDTSVEATGDLVGALDALLADADVGLAGRWGVRTPNGFDFEESDGVGGHDVDGVEGYLIAGRRSTFRDVGLFDPKFKWYRNADIDYSFKVRAAGLRTIVDASVPVTRHEHRLWESTPEAERDQLSRKNFWRFRDHWGERGDLLVTK